MELDKTKSWPYYLLGFSIVFIIILGGWWLYLVFTLAIKLRDMNSPILQGNLVMMVQWEGLAFLTITTFVGIAIIYVFFQDNKKSRSTQLFYASLTHELKTPLASMRLQAQVLTDLIKKVNMNDEERAKVEKYSIRLEEDSNRLENEIDRHLQLSRVDLASHLNIESINLSSFLKDITKNYSLTFNIPPEEYNILADQSACLMIFKNLIENTIKHQPSSNTVEIKISKENENIILEYNDHGKAFSGDIKKLSHLFYKHESPKGSGIGLYLIRKLMHKQNGSFKIINTNNLIFILTFKEGHSFE